MSGAKAQSWSGDPLPRGRHKLSPETVRASQRERLLRAMAELIGEQGYGATTVPEVIARARVSSNTFYKFFSDKTDCFIALCEQLGEQLFDHLASFATGFETPAESLDALRAGVHAYVAWWPDRPALARAYFVELPAAGPRAIEERDRQIKRFEAILRLIGERARELAPETPPLRDVEVSAASTAARELIAKEVRAGRVEQLGEIEPDLRYLLLKLLVSDRAAHAAEGGRQPD